MFTVHSPMDYYYLKIPKDAKPNRVRMYEFILLK